jgi:hypothetical protein
VGEMDRFWEERSARSSGRARQNWVDTIYRVGCERSTTLGGGGGSTLTGAWSHIGIRIFCLTILLELIICKY